ncbi:tetratricopeptide repeat protein [Solihabitans fulvus]|uniref:Tetratricopeptide repeat protein n=1 Tax=Solihabitans fulvus TaxID=1892852 RepID=A0A5B2X4M4_9PSEU|nr:NB-ARC domain-containing protein [Solihabitans fulvus]KAA2258110.1 tetratricopeptide repeat protein [Solihabitans fulvus]
MSESTGHNEVSGTVLGNLVQAYRIDNLVIQAAPAAPKPPWVLPAAHSPFVDRAGPIAEVNRLLDEAAEREQLARFAITGIGGVGKTALAVHLAYEIGSRFVDGVVFAELGGSAPTGAVPVGSLLATLLRQLGCTDIPASDTDKAAEYQRRTAGRAILVVLDDAHTARQVNAVLPASTSSAVLVTSRNRLDGLRIKGFHPTELDPLATPVALELISDVIGGTLRPEDRIALETLVGMCDGLPLALHIAGIQLRTRYRGSVTRFVTVLGDERNRLKALAVDEDLFVGAVFEVSYRELAGEQARAYRLLGLWDGADFDVRAAATLLDRSPDDTEELLADLVQANLLGEQGADRYRFHSLVRLHASARAEEFDAQQERTEALRRMVAHYLRFLVARDKVLSARPRACEDLYDAVPAEYAGPLATARALADLEAERANLLAAVLTAAKGEFGDSAWQLCVGLFPLYFQRSHFDDWITTHQAGLAEAERVDNLAARVQLHNQLGSAYFELGDNARAREQFERAFDLADGPVGRQSPREWIGFIHERAREFDEALRCFDEARALAEQWPDETKKPRAFALYDMHSGRVLVATGRAAQAVARLTDAWSFFAGNGDPVNVAKTAVSLGQAQLDLGRTEEALANLRQALEVLGEQGSLAWQAYLHAAAAVASERLGLADHALRHGAESQRIATELAERQRDAEADLTRRPAAEGE